MSNARLWEGVVQLQINLLQRAGFIGETLEKVVRPASLLDSTSLANGKPLAAAVRMSGLYGAWFLRLVCWRMQ